MALPQADWLRHGLTVSGPSHDVLSFQRAARGAGAIPWQLPDLSLTEEDQLHALLNPPDGSRGLSLAAAQILASQLRSAVENHADRVIEAARQGRGCPLDLHALLPIPALILQRGPDHPGSRAWLRQHWGIVQSLRQVRLLTGMEDHHRRRAGKITYEFWSADWTPWAAILGFRAKWPSLIFDCRPDYSHG
ncbi:hypothetical protein [Acidisoma silvae]|uniref:Uncharacterized protein n=1 Tax=Acidisoma silvae TaxID=2802396 RepID=A0A964E0D9_9PROT|nr:hypothetical protein [Acidisoma silvae]MCB8877064.1 hypothetical protein [Acidisoma silvae]